MVNSKSITKVTGWFILELNNTSESEDDELKDPSFNVDDVVSDFDDESGDSEEELFTEDRNDSL